MIKICVEQKALETSNNVITSALNMMMQWLPQEEFAAFLQELTTLSSSRQVMQKLMGTVSQILLQNVIYSGPIEKEKLDKIIQLQQDLEKLIENLDSSQET